MVTGLTGGLIRPSTRAQQFGNNVRGARSTHAEDLDRGSIGSEMKEKHKSRFMAVMKEDMGLVLVTGGWSGDRLR